MPSETERITNEFMDRHSFTESGENTGGEHFRKPARGQRDGDDPNFLNPGYMELERPSRNKSRQARKDPLFYP